MERNVDRQLFDRAKRKVHCLRKFYTHLIIYFVVNVMISSVKIIRNLNQGDSFEEAVFDFSSYGLWILWGIGIVIHAISVFGLPMVLGENWEEEKIKMYMNDNEKSRWK
jgi:hypothetical protein